MRENGNDIVYENILSTQSAANIEGLIRKFINIKSSTAYWLNIFYQSNTKDRTIQKR